MCLVMSYLVCIGMLYLRVLFLLNAYTLCEDSCSVCPSVSLRVLSCLEGRRGGCELCAWCSLLLPGLTGEDLQLEIMPGKPISGCMCAYIFLKIKGKAQDFPHFSHALPGFPLFMLLLALHFAL